MDSVNAGRVSQGFLHELATYTHLITSFARRDIRARYNQTVFGLAWAVLEPLSLMVVLTVVFGRFARIPSDGIPYPVFSYRALIFWTFFTRSISQGTTVMVANASLVRKIYFPRETLLLAVLVSTGLDLVVAAMIVAGMLVFYKIVLTWAVLWVIPLLIIQVFFT